MNIILTAILVVLLVSFGLTAFYIRRAYRALLGFLTPQEDGKPSPVAVVADAFCSMLARAVVMQAKATFMGVQSGAARAEKAIQADIAEDMVNQSNPMLGAALASFPALRKTLRRNPGLVDIALQYLASRQGVPGGNHSKETASPKFKL